MGSKPFLTIFSLLVFGYILFIMVASDPLVRVNRICAPVIQWPERAVIAATRIASPNSEAAMRQSFGHGYQTCRRWVWGTLYQPEYERMKAEHAARVAAAKKGGVVAHTDGVTDDVAADAGDAAE